MAETLVHAVPLSHFDLEEIVDQICGCGGIKSTRSVSEQDKSEVVLS